ncbi:hypothetical protein GJ629_05335 [Halapricum sp. CBA1109]|uniref:hypothetical protein n=1 Tax=Halapricum sp. CBA1109 TaxID=2668068 RepID=UPI0012FC94E1|nr:hypothetical protein [Halapricum sp. CBA1109]MUV89396.1 hypothetical protein [Halapricum sp. CBA1109]
MSRSPFGLDRSTVRDAVVVAGTELRAQYRHLRNDLRQGLATAFSLAMFGLFVPLFVLGSAVEFGSRLAAGSVPLGTAGVASAALLVVSGYVGAAGGFNQKRLGNVGPLVRTSVPPLAVSLSRLLDRLVQSLLVLVPACLLLLAGVAVGAGGVFAPVLVVAWALPVLAAGLFVGRAIGSLARYLNEWLGLSLWLKAALVLTLAVGSYVGVMLVLTNQFGTTGEFGGVAIPAFLPGRPLQAYGALAFAPLGAAPGPVGALVAVCLLAAVPLGLVTALRVETRILLTDFGGEENAAAVTRGVPRPFGATPSLRVAWRYLLRTRRDPRMLAHLAPLLFGAFGLVASAVQDPESLLFSGPITLFVGGVTLAGAAYCLNPLGDDRDQLPLLLTSTASTAVLLRGRALAGTALGLVPAAVIAGPVSAVSFSPAFALGQTLLAVVLSLAGSGTALGLGAIAPKFERREAMGVERPHPSNIAVFGLLFGGIGVGLAGLGLVWWTLSGASLAIVGIAWVVYLLVVSAIGAAGYAYALRTFDALTLDDV